MTDDNSLAPPPPVDIPPEPDPANPMGHRDEVLRLMLEESIAMAEHANAEGKVIADDILVLLNACGAADANDEAPDPVALNKVHAALAALVAPAMPGALSYIRRERGSGNAFMRLFGPISTIRIMVLACVLSLVIFIILAGSGFISKTALNLSLFAREGASAYLIPAMLVAAAAVGVSFSNLYKARQYVVAGTYEPKYNTTYWMRFVLGLTAGYVIAEVVPIDMSKEFDKPLLALLGGVSADAIYSILQRLVEALRTIVQGDVESRIKQNEAEWQSRLSRQSLQQNLDMAREVILARDEMKTAGATDAQVQKLDEIIKTLLENKPAPPTA